MPATTGFAATHTGYVRASNEDCFATSGGEGERWSGELEPGSGWALVADGMGGHVAGEVASALAVAHLSAALADRPDSSAIPELLQQANMLLYAMMAQKPGLTGMGTTIGGVCYAPGRLVAFNVGDSRIYLHQRGRLEQLSEDHVVHGHVLTQCLGGYASPEPLRPHVAERPLERPSRVLLCTDGLTDEVADEEIAALLGSSGDPAAALVDAALAAGGRDNVTAVVLDFA